eukprot:10421063-Alexandrium_andersonii.AAC.1
MSASLVGSEMCIRDRRRPARPQGPGPAGSRGRPTQSGSPRERLPGAPAAVSYTHLTLPTICSV